MSNNGQSLSEPLFHQMWSTICTNNICMQVQKADYITSFSTSGTAVRPQ